MDVIEARRNLKRYQTNVSALQQVHPQDLSIDELNTITVIIKKQNRLINNIEESLQECKRRWVIVMACAGCEARREWMKKQYERSKERMRLCIERLTVGSDPKQQNNSLMDRLETELDDDGEPKSVYLDG